MQRRLTITVDEEIYRGFHEHVGRDNISDFIAGLARPQLALAADLDEGYRAMAADTDREQDAVA